MGEESIELAAFVSIAAPEPGVNESGGQTKERRFSTACGAIAHNAEFFPSPGGSKAILSDRRAVGNQECSASVAVASEPLCDGFVACTVF